jgi:hypothetical protein
MTTLAKDIRPGPAGPKAHKPELICNFFAAGPFTIKSGAWGPVDIAISLKGIAGSCIACTAAIKMGKIPAYTLPSLH